MSKHSLSLWVLSALLLSACAAPQSSSQSTGQSTLQESSSIDSSVESSSSSSSSSKNPMNKTIYSDDAYALMKESLSRYQDQSIGSFDRYHLAVTQGVDGTWVWNEMYYDAAKHYARQIISGDAPETGNGYIYGSNGTYIEAMDVVNHENGDVFKKEYRYLSEEAYQFSMTGSATFFYDPMANNIDWFLNQKESGWENVTFQQADVNEGSLHLRWTGKQKNTETSDNGCVGEIIIENYVVKKMSARADEADMLFEVLFDEDEFELEYPDLTKFTLIEEEPIKDENDPLTEDEFLVDMRNDRNYYQLLVYSFADSNGDGIGDFKGIVDHLDYLVNLGIEGLWLSPILSADSYHSYDINDYYTINQDYIVTIDGVTYGVNYLLRECHKRGIKVLMDLVINHTSPYHPWRYEHPDWYGSDNRFGFPEFNYDNTEVRQAVTDVGTYWLGRGFDGFRLDAAMWIYNSGSDRHQKNYAFWQQWCAAMKEAKPDCYLIGEVLDEDHDLAYSYAQAGFDSTFDFNALKNVITSTKGTNASYWQKTQNDRQKALQYNENYILGRALSNHDIGRFNEKHQDSTEFDYDVQTLPQIKLANAINALTPGNTFVYYGDELGLRGTCEDTSPGWYFDMNYRTPMPWSEGTTVSTSYFGGFHGSGVTTSTTFSGNTADVDADSGDSIYSALRNALMAKKHNEILRKGTLQAPTNLPAGLRGFSITYDGLVADIVYLPGASADTIQYNYSGEVLYTLNCAADNGVASFSEYSLIAVLHN